MKFLCLVYVSEAQLAALTPAEQQALDRDSLAYDELLKQRGQFVTAQALDSSRKAVSLRRVNGRLKQTDGPYAEAKEVVGGFILVETASLDEALGIASMIPVVRYGGVE